MKNLSFNIDTRASSGTIEKLFHGSSSYGYYIGVDWKVNSQSASSNSSNVTATVYIRTTGSGVSISSSATKTVSVTIDGTKYISNCTVGIGTNTKKNLFSKTVTVGHDSNGAKSCAFACALDINVTLGGTYYGKISASGSGTFNTINLNTAPVWVSGGRITIKNGSTILTDQANGTENAVKFPENVGTLNISWSGATDANNDTITYELYEQVDNSSTWNNIYTGTAKSYSRSIGAGSSTQGKMYDYYVKARDSKNAYASGTQDGTQVQKNTLNGSTLASNSSIKSTTESIVFTWNAGSNTDGSAVKYDLTASGVTVNRATNLTATSLTVAIVDTAPSSGAYILKSDLKNKFAGSSYNGNLTFTLTTKNNYSSSKTTTKAISVDLRTNPTPAIPTIDKSANSKAYHRVATTGVSYFVPDGTKNIRVNWTNGSDSLGTALKYDVQVKIGSGGFETKHTNLTTNSCDLILPKQSNQQTFVVRVITKTAYNFTKESDTVAEFLEFYNPPSVDVTKISRTSTGVTATIKLNANTSIPNVNFPTRTYAGVSSGTLANSRNAQDITASGLEDNRKYSWTITVKDDVGLYTTDVVKTIEVPAYTPLFSVREKGVGINAIPDGTAGLIVNGGMKLKGSLKMDSPNGAYKNKEVLVTREGDANGMGVAIQGGGTTVIGGGESAITYLNSVANPATEELSLTSDQSVYVHTNMQNGVAEKKTFEFNKNGAILTPNGEVLTRRGDGVTEIGKYVDFHDTGSTSDYDVRLQCNGNTLGIQGALSVANNIGLSGYIQLANYNGTWINGATNSAIRTSKLSTGAYHPIIAQTTSSNHKISMGGIDNKFGFYIYDANRTANGVDKSFEFNLANKDMYTNCRIHMDEWLYTNGNNGLYFPTHGGGWHMTDSTWIRAYGNKSIYTGGTVKADTQVQTKKIEFANDDNITYDDTNNIFNFTSDNSVNNSKIRCGYLWSGSASGAECRIAPNWSGSQGTEFSFYNTKGNGWGFIGNSGTPWYRVYGTGGSVSARERKYDITKADIEEHYENIKSLNVYNYRTISNEQDVDGNVVKEFKRQDLMLGCMVDELPTETTFYDNEGGDGKAVDMYSYTTMILGGTKHLIKKVETLEKENELKDMRIDNLERRLEKMEELLNGIIDKR